MERHSSPQGNQSGHPFYGNQYTSSRDDRDERMSRGRGGGYEDRGRFGGEDGRSRGGYESSHSQSRDEYGRFIGHEGGGPGYESRSSYDDRGNRFGGYESRSRGGYDSSRSQDRDDYGRFEGNRNRGYDSQGYDSRSGYDDRGSRFGGYEGRSRGGYESSHAQDRDEYGRFEGRR